MAEGNENYQYDFCIFYKEDDKQARDVTMDILNYLEKNEERQVQLKGYIGERDATAGQSHISNIDTAITTSRLVIVIISEVALSCNWFELKLHASLTHQLNGNLRNNVIPIYTGQFQTVSPSLNTKTGINYDPDRQSSFWKKLKKLFYEQA